MAEAVRGAEALPVDTGPCQAPRVYQPSHRVDPAPCQKTSCVEPSAVTVALGDEGRMAPPLKAPSSPRSVPMADLYQDSWR